MDDHPPVRAFAVEHHKQVRQKFGFPFIAAGCYDVHHCMAGLQKLLLVATALGAGAAAGFWTPLMVVSEKPGPIVQTEATPTQSDVAPPPSPPTDEARTLATQSPDLIEAEVRAQLAANDPDAMLAALKRLALVDSYRALKVFLNFKRPQGNPEQWWKLAEAIHAALLELPVNAEGLLRALLEGDIRRDDLVARSVFGALARKDPQHAWETLMASPYRASSYAAGAVGKQWAKVNPRAALDFIASQPVTVSRSQFIRALTEEWGQSAAGDLLAWFRTQPDRLRWDDDISWAKVRPQNAAEFAALWESLPPRFQRASSADQGRIKEIFSHASSAADYPVWLRAMPKGAARLAAVQAYADYLLARDPEAAMAWRGEIIAPNLRRRISSTVAAYRAAESPQAGIDFALSLRYQETREAALQSVVDTWAQRDRNAALTAALAHPEWKIGFNHIVEKWAAADGSGATSFAVDHGQEWLAQNAMRQWVRQSPESASAWVLALPAGGRRDKAAAALTWAVMDSDPAASVSWAQSLTDTKQRSTLMTKGFAKWIKEDRAAATEWLGKAPLDDASRQSLQATLAKESK